jgi:hypothetical protein
VSEEIRKYIPICSAHGKEKNNKKKKQAEIEGSENCASGLGADRKHVLE